MWKKTLKSHKYRKLAPVSGNNVTNEPSSCQSILRYFESLIPIPCATSILRYRYHFAQFYVTATKTTNRSRTPCANTRSSPSKRIRNLNYGGNAGRDIIRSGSNGSIGRRVTRSRAGVELISHNFVLIKGDH